jgi:glyoxylase-like metal-dependent hydrolase (beta-lactamase superfamily II)
MKRTALLLVASLVVMSCATAAQRSRDLVGRAVEATGAVAGVQTLWVKGTMRQWEPEQSAMAGGEMRLTNDATFEKIVDGASGAARTDIVRKFVYPAPRTFTFSEIVTPQAGYVGGIDSGARNKQSLESNPPAHAMSGLRLAASQRELLRTSPLLVQDMWRNPDRVAAAGDVTVGAVSYPAVDYRGGDQTLTVMFDRETGLPARIRTLDYDNVWGDVTYDLVLADWRAFDGIRVATSQKYELNGRAIMDIKISEVKANVPVPAERVMIPAAFKAGAAKPATGPIPYQWVIRRQFIGLYMDSDVPSWDTRVSSGLRLAELAPGVHHLVGGTAHSLVVEMRDHLIVFDAPVTDAHSNLALAVIRAKFGAKPVKYLVLTHHHMDHIGGLRVYAAQGATLVVGKGNAEHLRRVLAAPFGRNPDLAARDLRGTPIVEVADKHVLTDGTREVHAYLIDNPHAAGLLIGYVPEARLGFVTDIWSPGPPLPASITPPQKALVEGVKKAGISPLKFAGGHGSTADFAPLVALAAK